MREKYVYFQQTASASRNVGELSLIAVDKSSKGNLISIEIVESGTESQVTISVSGNAITAAIGTSNDQHAGDIRDAINADPAASALVTASSSGTTAITAAVGQGFLSGGGNGVSFPLSSFAGMHPIDNDTIRIYFKSMRNFDGTTSRANHVVVSDHVKINTIGTDTTGTQLRQTMDAICKAFTSSRTRPYDIVIGDDRGDGTEYINSALINDISSITIAAANS
tara:strand:- start:108 stop:776 length:669 start_codon:yes stop_codon:yes gene_type:complete